MANFIGRLGVLLGLDSAEFQRGIQQASRQLDAFVDKARTTAAVGATAFAAMAYQAMKLADEIVDTAKANDIAVDSVLKLRNALALSGGDAESAGKLYSSFTANIDKAAEGSFETQKTFKMLRVSLDDLRKMNINELFSKTVQSLSNMSDPLTRNAKAMELFGKAAKGVDFVALNEELKTGAGVTDAQAKAIEDAAAAYDALAKAGRDFNIMLATELGPALKTTLDYLGGTKEVLSGVGTVFRTVFETVAVLGANVAFVFKSIADEIAHTIQNATLLAKLDIKGAIAANEAHAAKQNQRRLELDAFENRVMGGGGGYGGGKSDFDDPRRLDRPKDKPRGGTTREVKPGIDKEAEAAKKKADDEAKKRQALIARGVGVEMQQREENARLMAEQETMYQKGNAAQIQRQQLANTEIDRAKEMLELVFQGRNMRGEDLQLAQELKTIEWNRLDAIKAINADETLTRDARAAALVRENELAGKAVDLARQRNELTKQTREGTFADGFFKAAEDAGRNAATALEQGQQVFQSVMGNMEAAINNFVRTGKLSFKDLARSIIQDIIAIQMRAAATRMLASMFGAPATATSSYGASGGMTEHVFNPNRAEGGPVEAGKMGLVGEKGPELFVPRSNGTIIPNNRLQDALGGGTTNVTNNYINAIDTKSFEDRLLGSSNAIWAANMYANKSLASNGRRA
jgi:lambda family phage tail tape measure protein